MEYVPDKNAPGEPHSIFLLSVETGEKRRLTSPRNEYFGDWNPRFSPDGMWNGTTTLSGPFR